MAMQTWQPLPGWPGANAKKVRTIKATWTAASDVKEAHAWMQQDKANRVIEGVQRFPYGHDQNLWARVDKSKPIGFECTKLGVRWLSFYPEAEQPGGCLHNYTGDEFKKEMEIMELERMGGRWFK